VAFTHANERTSVVDTGSQNLAQAEISEFQQSFRVEQDCEGSVSA